jgi:hypothetical protein
MCALCSNGYFKSLRDCNRCEHPRVGAVIGVIVAVLMIAVVVRVTLRRYSRSLGLANTFAHLKVIVSFVTVAATLDSQFG